MHTDVHVVSRGNVRALRSFEEPLGRQLPAVVGLVIFIGPAFIGSSVCTLCTGKSSVLKSRSEK